MITTLTTRGIKMKTEQELINDVEAAVTNAEDNIDYAPDFRVAYEHLTKAEKALKEYRASKGESK